MNAHGLTLLTLAALSASLSAATVVIDDFEGGSFNSDWDATTGATITAGAGAQGSSNFTSIAGAGGPLGATFDGGASDFTIDFYTQVVTTTNRQFNLQVSTDSVVPNTNAATVNLRHQGGGWDAYDGAAWQPLPTLNAMTAGQWYHVRLTGNGWGSAGATFDVDVSDAGGSAFTSSSIGNTFYQTGNPNTTMAASFNFNAVFGTNPGFSVDNVTVETIPEPSVALLGLAALSFSLIRRRR